MRTRPSAGVGGWRPARDVRWRAGVLVRGLVVVSLVATTLAVSVLGASPSGATFPGNDGSIVFSYDMGSQSDLYRMDVDGTHRQRLTATPNVYEFGPSWNAAGTAIVFWQSRIPFGPVSIWVMDADGGNKVRLTSGIDAIDPVWSPSGLRIAFTRITPYGRTDIWTMRASDGTGRRQITSWTSEERAPAWSPDGRSLAFTRSFGSPDGDRGDIWTVDLASGRFRRVVSTPYYDDEAAWAPDGSRIAFERLVGRGSLATAKIATVRPDGTGFHTLTSGHLDYGPVYSPTGTSIAFSSYRSSAGSDLWVMQSNGTNLRRIRDLPHPSWQPDWQPVAP